MTILLRKPPKDGEEEAASRNKYIVPCGIVALPCHPHCHMRTRRGRSLFNRPPHSAALALDAYRSELNARVNRLLWDLVSSATFVGVLLATAYVMHQARALEQNLTWRALFVDDRQSTLDVVRIVHFLFCLLNHTRTRIQKSLKMPRQYIKSHPLVSFITVMPKVRLIQ